MKKFHKKVVNKRYSVGRSDGYKTYLRDMRLFLNIEEDEIVRRGKVTKKEYRELEANHMLVGLKKYRPVVVLFSRMSGISVNRIILGCGCVPEENTYLLSADAVVREVLLDRMFCSNKVAEKHSLWSWMNDMEGIVNEILMEYYAGCIEYPVLVSDIICHKYGLRIVKEDIEGWSETFEFGIKIANQILPNQKLVNYVLAHALGHSLLHKRYYLCGRDDIFSFSSTEAHLYSDDDFEVSARYFARCLLLPRKQFSRCCQEGKSIDELSELFECHKDGVIARLRDIGYIPIL